METIFANYRINLLHSRFGVDYFNVIDGASNSMELIQFFADVVDVNNDKISNGF
jgi:capsule polysaccharide export protein KpsE/RkpR